MNLPSIRFETLSISSCQLNSLKIRYCVKLTLKGNSKLGTVANFTSEPTGIISEFIITIIMITICVCVCTCACLLVEGRKQLLV